MLVLVIGQVCKSVGKWSRCKTDLLKIGEVDAKCVDFTSFSFAAHYIDERGCVSDGSRG